VDPKFVHLHLHTEYSLVDGLVGVKPLVKALRKGGMPAVAVTDQCNLFSLVRFYKAALGAGIKPIAGSDLWVRNPADGSKPHRLVLLVQDRTGYGNLTRLISRAYVEGQHLGVPQVEREWIAQASRGLIALSGGPGGDVALALLAGNRPGAEALLDRWLAVFGDRYYLELIRTGRESEAELVERSVDLAIAKGVPVVATNDVRFLAREDFEAHEVRVCIHEGRTLDDPRRPRRFSEEQYLRTPAEMAVLFADIPEALENSVEIAKRCNLELSLGRSFLPDFPVPRWASRLLPDRRRLHQLGQAQRHPGRPGARLRRRLAGRLCARHHRPRPAALRPAVRALPEPRAGVDARLRHRLLPGTATA
jgi:DNA polymerase-3 subunit alpha